MLIHTHMGYKWGIGQVFSTPPFGGTVHQCRVRLTGQGNWSCPHPLVVSAVHRPLHLIPASFGHYSPVMCRKWDGASVQALPSMSVVMLVFLCLCFVHICFVVPLFFCIDECVRAFCVYFRCLCLCLRCVCLLSLVCASLYIRFSNS